MFTLKRYHTRSVSVGNISMNALTVAFAVPFAVGVAVLFADAFAVSFALAFSLAFAFADAFAVLFIRALDSVFATAIVPFFNVMLPH